MAPGTLLEHLRSLGSVGCDTLDVQVAEKLGPFTDCTSNQAIAFAELTKLDADGRHLYQDLINDSLTTAHWMLPKQADATVEELAVELMMVQLSLKFASHVTGHLFVQTNPKWSYSTDKTVKNAERLLAHFRHVAPDFDAKRVCIKIPATWEGIQACRVLEGRGIATLATIAFCTEQAVVAAHAGCTYIAPYVNELRVHFDASYRDPDKGFDFCQQAQRYFETSGVKTKVCAASLTSIEEVVLLAGVHLITVSPPLLAELAATTALDLKRPSSFDAELRFNPDSVPRDEAGWRMALTRSKAGRNEGKLIQAINIFADVQDQLESLARSFQARA